MNYEFLIQILMIIIIYVYVNKTWLIENTYNYWYLHHNIYKTEKLFKKVLLLVYKFKRFIFWYNKNIYLY